MTKITRKLEFDAGHRVLGHEGRCAALHGHRYVAEITVEAPELDKLGRVVDFGVIKDVVGKWVDDNWDHNFLVHPDDPLALMWLNWESKTPDGQFADTFTTAIFNGKKPYIFTAGKNPTAENIAEVLYHKAQHLLIQIGGVSKDWIPNHKTNTKEYPPLLKIVNVRIWETPNCWADYPG